MENTELTDYQKNIKFMQDFSKEIQDKSSQLEGFNKSVFASDIDLNSDWDTTVSKINTKNPNYSPEDLQRFRQIYKSAMQTIGSEYATQGDKNAAYASLGDIPSEVFEELHKQNAYEQAYNTNAIGEIGLTPELIDEDGNRVPLKDLEYDTVDADALPTTLRPAAFPLNSFISTLRSSDSLLSNTGGALLEGTINLASSATNGFLDTLNSLTPGDMTKWSAIDKHRTNIEASLESRAQELLQLPENDMEMVNRVLQEDVSGSNYYSADVAAWLQKPENREKVKSVREWNNLQTELKNTNEMLDFGFTAPTPQSADRYVNNVIWDEISQEWDEGHELYAIWDTLVGAKRAIFSIAGSGMLDILNTSANSLGELYGSATAGSVVFGPVGGVAAVARKLGKVASKVMPKGVRPKLFSTIESAAKEQLMHRMTRQGFSFMQTYRGTVHEAYANEDLESNLWSHNNWANIGLFAAALADFAGDRIAAKASHIFADKYLRSLFTKNNGFLARKVVAEALANEGALTQPGLFGALKRSAIGRFFNDTDLGRISKNIVRETLLDISGEAFAGTMEQLIQDFALHGVSVKDTAANAIISAFCIPGTMPFNMEMRAIESTRLAPLVNGMMKSQYTNMDMAKSFHDAYMSDAGPEQVAPAEINYDTYSSDENKRKQSQNQASELSTAYERNRPNSDAKTTANGIINDLQKSLDERAKKTETEPSSIQGRTLPRGAEKAINEYVRERNKLEKEYENRATDQSYQDRLDRLNKKAVSQMYGNYFSDKKAETTEVADKIDVTEERKTQLNRQWTNLAHASDYESSEGVSTSSNEHQITTAYADKRLQLEKTRNELRRELKKNPGNTEIEERLNEITQEINKLDAQYPDSGIKRSIRAFLEKNAAELHEVNPTMSTEYSSRLSGNKSLELEKDYRDFAKAHNLNQVDRFSTAFQSGLISDIQMGNAESAARARRLLKDLYDEYNASLDKAIKDRKDFLAENTTRNSKGELVPKRNAAWKDAVNIVTDALGGEDVFKENLTSSQLKQMQEEIRKFQNNKAELKARYDSISELKVNATEVADAIDAKVETDLGLPTDEEVADLVKGAEVANVTGGTIDSQVDETDLDIPAGSNDVTETDISALPENPTREVTPPAPTETKTETESGADDIPDVEGIDAGIINDELENQASAPESKSGEETTPEEATEQVTQDLLEKEAENKEEETAETVEVEETEPREPTEFETKYPQIAELSNKLMDIYYKNGETETAVPEGLPAEIEAVIKNLNDNPDNFKDTLLLDGLLSLANTYSSVFEGSPKLSAIDEAIHKFSLIQDIEKLEARLTRRLITEDRNDIRNYYHTGLHLHDGYAEYLSFLQWVDKKYNGANNLNVDLNAEFQDYYAFYLLGSEASKSNTQDTIERYRSLQNQVHNRIIDPHVGWTSIEIVNVGMQKLHDANYTKFIEHVTDCIQDFLNQVNNTYTGVTLGSLINSWVTKAFIRNLWESYKEKATIGIIEISKDSGDLSSDSLNNKFIDFIQETLHKINADGRLPDIFIDRWAYNRYTGLGLEENIITAFTSKIPFTEANNKTKEYKKAKDTHRLNQEDLDKYVTSPIDAFAVLYSIDPHANDEFTESEAELDTDIRGNSPEGQRLGTRGASNVGRGDDYKGQKNSITDMLRDCYGRLLAGVRSNNSKTINETWSSIALLIVNQARKAFHGKIVGGVTPEMYKQLYQDLDTCLTFITNVHTNPKFAEVREAMLRPEFKGLQAWLASIKTLRSTILELNELAKYFPAGMSLDEVASRVSPQNPITIEIHALDGTPKGTKTYSSPDQILRLKNIVFPRSPLNSALQTAEVFTCIPLDYETSRELYTEPYIKDGKYDNTTPRKYIQYLSYSPDGKKFTPVESDNTGDISFCFRSDNWIKKITQENVETTSVRKMESQGQRNALGPLYAEAHEHLQGALQNAPIITIEDAGKIASDDVIRYPSKIEDGTVPVTFNGTTSDVHWYNAISPDCELGSDANGVVWQFNGFTLKHPNAIKIAAEKGKSNKVNRVFITSSPYMEDKKSFWDFLGLRTILRGTSPQKIEKQSLAAKSIAFTYKALIDNYFIPKGFINSDTQVSDKFSLGKECWQQVSKEEAERFWTTTAPEPIKKLFQIWQENVGKYIIEANTRVHKPSVSTTGMTTLYNSSVTIPRPAAKTTQRKPWLKTKDNKDFSNLQIHSGGALGADSIWSRIAEGVGVPRANIHHYTTKNRPIGRQQEEGKYWDRQRAEQDTGTAEDVQGELQDLRNAMLGNKNLEGKIFPGERTLQDVLNSDKDGLQTRNYKQVIKSDQVFAVAPFDPNHKYVKGGTGTAVAMAIALGKPVYVLDTSSDPLQWYSYDITQKQFVPVPSNTVAIPTKGNVALIGSRSITSHAYKNNKGEWNTTTAPKNEEQIRAMMADAFGVIGTIRESIAPDEQAPENTPADDTAIAEALQPETPSEVKPEQMSEAAEMPAGGDDDSEEAAATPEPQSAPAEAAPVTNPQAEEKGNLIRSLAVKWHPKQQPTLSQKQVQITNASEASPIPVTPPINPTAIGNTSDTTEVQSSDEGSGGVLVSRAETYKPNVNEESLKQANATFSTIAFIRSNADILIGRMQETQRTKGEKAVKELLRRFTAWALANVGVVPKTLNSDGTTNWAATAEVAEKNEHFESTLNMLTKILAPCNLLTKKSTEAEIQEATNMCVNNINLHSSFLELFSIFRKNTTGNSFGNRLQNCLPDTQFKDEPLRQVLMEALDNFTDTLQYEATRNSVFDKICITGLDFLCSKYLYKGVRKGTRLNWESPIVKSLLIGITDDAEVEANLQYIRENNPPEVVNDLAAAFCVQSTFANALGDALYQALNFDQYLGNQNYTNEKKSYLKGVLGEIATVIMCDSGFLTLKTRRVKMLDEIKTVSMITGRGQEEVDIEVDENGKETPKQVTLDTLREFSRLATTSDVQDLYSTEARNENVVKTSPDDVHPDVSMNNHKPANDKNAEMIKETAQTPFKIPNYYVDMFSKLLKMSRGGVSLFQYLTSEFQKGNSLDFSADGWLMKNFKTAMEVLGITAIDGLDGETKNAVQIQNEKHLNVILTVVNKHKEFQSRKKDIKDIDPNEDGLLFWTTYSMGNNSRFTLMGSDLNPQADKEFTRQFCFSTKGEVPVRLDAKHKVGNQEFSEHQVLAFGILQNLDKKPEKKVKVSNWTTEARKPIMVALRGAFATKNARNIVSRFKAYNDARKALEDAGYPFEHPVAILNTMQTMEQFLENINSEKELDDYIKELENAESTEKFYEILENHLPQDGIYTNYMHIESDGVTNGPAIGVTYVVGMRDYLAKRFENVPDKDSVDFLDAIGVSTNRENMYDSKDKNHPDGVVQDLYEYIKSHLPIDDMFNKLLSAKGDIATCTFKDTGIKFIDFLVANFDANADDIIKKETEFFDSYTDTGPTGTEITEFYQGLIGDILTRDLIKGPATQGSYGAMLGAVTRGLLTHPIGGIFTTFKKKINSPEFKNNPEKVREAFNKFIRALVDLRGANKIYEYQDLTGHGFLENQKSDKSGFSSSFETSPDAFNDVVAVREGIKISLFQSLEDADKRRDAKDEKATWLASHPNAYLNEFYLEANRDKLFHFENQVGTQQGHMADPILALLMYQNSYAKPHGNEKAFDDFDILLRAANFRANDWFNDPEYRKEFYENHKSLFADICYELNYSVFIEEAQRIQNGISGVISGNIEEKAKAFAESRRNNGFPAKSVAIPGHALMENLTRLCISKIKASEEYAHKDTPDKVIKVFHDNTFAIDYINAINLLYSPEGEGFGLLPSVNIKNTVHLPNGKEFTTNLTNSVRTGRNQNTSTLGEYIFTEVFNSFNRKGSDYRTQHFHKDTLRNNQEIAQIYCDMESTFHEYSWTTPTATVEDANLKKLNEAEKANSFFIHGMPDDIARAMTGGNRDGRSYTSSNNTYQKMPCPLNVGCDGISFKNDFGETNVDLVVQSGRETPNVRLAKIKGIPVLNLNAQIRQVTIDGVPTYFEVNASNEDVFAKYGSQNDKVARIGDFIGAVANHIRNNRPKDGSYYMDTLMRMYAKDPDYFYTCMFKCAGAKGDLIGDGTGVLAKFMQDNVDRTVLYTKVMAKPKQVTNDFKEGKYDNGRTFTVDKLGRLSELVTPAFKDTMGSAVFSAIMDPMGGNRAMTQMSIAALPYYARICVHLLEIANSEDYVVQPTDTPQIAEIKKKYAEFIDTMVKRLMGGGLLKVGSGEFLPVMESSNENDIDNKIIVQDNKNISHFNSGKIALMMAIGIKMMVQSVHSQDSGIASFTGKTTGRGYLNIHDALEGLCNAGFFKGNLQQNIAFLNACLNPDAENNPDFNYVNFFSNVDGMYSVFDKLGSLGDIIPERITSAADASKMFNAVMNSDLRHSLNMTKICKGFIFWDKKTKKIEIKVDYREGESPEERAIRVAKFNEMLDQLDTLARIAHEFSGIYAGAAEKAWQDTVDEAFQGLQSYRDFRIHKDFSFNDTRGLMFYAMKRALAHIIFQGTRHDYSNLGKKGGPTLDSIAKDIENEGIDDTLIKNIDPKDYADTFLKAVRMFANPYALVDSKYAETASDPRSFTSYAVSMALNRVQLGKQGNKEVDPNYLWKVICEKHPDLVRMLYSQEVREGVLGIFRELLQGCAKAHDDAARALVSNNPKIFQYNVGFAENAEYLKNQNKIDAEEAEKDVLDKYKKRPKAYDAYKMAFNSQTKYAKEFYDLAGNDDVVLNCRNPDIPLSAMLETPDNPLVGLNAEDTTALLKETLENLENAPESWQDMADRLGMMQRAFTGLASELLENADSLLNDPSVSKINMCNTMDRVLRTGVYLNTSKGKLFISTPVFLKAIHGGLFNKLNDWAKGNTKSALQTVYNAAADVFNAYNTLYVANGIRTQEGDNFTQGVIKGNQADALAQSDQALRDAFNAIRNGQPLPNNMVREIEIATEQQLLNTYDSLSANVSMSNNTEMVGMSAEHDKTLRGRLEKLAGLFSGIKVLLGNKGTAGVAFTGGNTIAIQQGVADAMKAGIPMSTKEMFGHENCHIAFKAVDRNSKEFAQLKQAWRQARDYLATRKNLLMVHHWTAEELGSQALADQANQVEMQKAEARYDYMFGTGEAGSTANDLVEEFAVLAYTNEFVEKALKDVPFVASQGKSETSALGKLIDAIIEFVDGVFKKLTEKIKKNKIKVTPTLMTAVENVFDSLVETESRYDRIMKSEAMTRLSTKITKASNKIGEIEDVARDHISGWVSPNKKELVSRVVQTIREQGRLTRELINETLGTNFKDPSGRSIIASFINKITELNKRRQQNKALDAKFLTESFGNQLTKEEAKAIRDGVCILDLQCLKNIYSNDAIMELLTGSDEPVNQAVEHHKQMVRDSILATNLPEEFVNFVINCGNNLACKLATDSWSMALTHQNAAQILNAYGTDFVGVANGVPQDQALRLHQILDEYISLKAMQLYRQHADNADNMALLRELWRVEKASSKTARRSHGFNAVLNYHQATVQTSKEYIAANTINQDMGGLHQLVNVRKGYLKPQFSPYYEVVAVTTEEERTDLLHRGYKIYDGPEANLPNTISGMTIMYNTYPISSKHTSGALTTISNHAVGTNMEKEEEVRRYVGHNIGRNFGNLLIGELPITPNKEISIELGYTDEGNVKALRFVDSRAMREKLLEEDTNFANALAATSANICEKTISAEANRQLIDTLLDIMATEYNPAQESEWVIMAPDSENETVVQDYGNMPEDTRRYLFQRLQERGLDYLRVKKNHYNMVFGYHNASLRNLTDPSAEEDQTNKNIEERARTVFKQVAYNLLATKFGMAGQAVLEYLVHLAKDMVVNKSFIVSYKNLKSNIQLLSMAGVNPKDALALTLQGYKHFTAYNTQVKKIRKLRDEINYGDLPEATRKIKLSELRVTMQELMDNPMREYMLLGGSTNIVAGEYDVNQDAEFTPLRGVMKIFDENAGVAGKRIKPILNWLLIRHGSTPYDIAQELATGTDTVAKWIYYEYLKKNEFKEDTDEARTNAFMKAQETFISFDLPTNKWVQLGNDLGFLWFTKYLFRTQRVIATQFKEKPARTLCYLFLWKALHLPWLDGSIIPSNVFNLSSVTQKIANPITRTLGATSSLPVMQLLNTI